MELSEMTMKDVDERLAQLDVEVRESQDIEAVEKATEEKKALLERKAELKDLEERKANAEALQNGDVKADSVIEVSKEIREERNEMESKVFGTETKEYRDAFYAMLAGKESAEQRAILATPISVDGDGTDDGAAIAIPKSLDEKIWDNIHTAHPILEDITTVASGVVMEVTKHTAIDTRVSKKKDAATTADAEENTFVKVSLVGNDYEKYVELTYAEAKMSQGALEDYLAQEIAAELGEALAKDVFAQMITDAGTSQKVTPDASNPDLFADVKSALGLAVGGGKKVIYAPSSKYYEIVGAIKSGVPFNMGTTLGVEVKCDDAATKVTIVDPTMFVLNQVSGVLIESDRDIKKHRVVISGWMRAEGCMRNNKAVAYIN